MSNNYEAWPALGSTDYLFATRSEMAEEDIVQPDRLDDVYRYCFARLGSREDAEDAVMEVFMAANARPDRLRDASDPRLYLIGIARRKVVDVLRRRRRDRRPTCLERSEPTDGAERREVVRQALATLPENQREVLVLKYVQELSVQEIARVVRKSPQAVNSLLQRGRAAFRHGAVGLFEGNGARWRDEQ
jgi:RNA polymerase sigma-70 factor (ECF subfamily)